MSSFTRSGAYPWALVGIFAAVQLVMTAFPFTFAFGGGGFLSLGLVAAPIIGYLLGPFFGTISVLIGSFLGVSINVALHPLALFTPIAPAASALVAGSLRVKKPIVVPLVYVAAMAIFLVSPIAGLSYTFLWFHIIALILSFLFLIPLFREKLENGLEMDANVGYGIAVVSIWLLSLISVLADQLVGSTIGAFYFLTLGLDVPTLAGFYTGVIFIYPIERTLASIIAAFVIVALAKFLARTYFDLPTTPLDSGIRELPAEEIQ
ncbi:MAG: hypothetical protein ACXABY_29515 [Candidatus Thorarchaeota archaeon]|jgi:hypothetical protein